MNFSNLEAIAGQDFVGLRPVSGLWLNAGDIPAVPGVYLVLRLAD